MFRRCGNHPHVISARIIVSTIDKVVLFEQAVEFNVKKSGRAPSQRQLRVGEVLRHSLSEVFLRGETGVSEIDQAGLTVLEVTMSPDLKNATAFVMPLGGKNAPKVLEALDEMRKRIRGLLSKKVKLK